MPSPADEKDSGNLEDAASPGPEPKGAHADALRKNDDDVDMNSHKNANDNTSAEDTSGQDPVFQKGRQGLLLTPPEPRHFRSFFRQCLWLSSGERPSERERRLDTFFPLLRRS